MLFQKYRNLWTQLVDPDGKKIFDIQTNQPISDLVAYDHTMRAINQFFTEGKGSIDFYGGETTMDVFGGYKHKHGFSPTTLYMGKIGGHNSKTITVYTQSSNLTITGFLDVSKWRNKPIVENGKVVYRYSLENTDNETVILLKGSFEEINNILNDAGLTFQKDVKSGKWQIVPIDTED